MTYDRVHHSSWHSARNSQRPMYPKRLYNLDVSRGLAALSVVVWHWQHFFFSRERLADTFQRDSQPLYSILSPFYEHGGHFAVSFFFILSGFVFFWLYHDKIATNRCSFYQFWVYRFARLYPLHFATLLLTILLQGYFHFLNGHFFVYGFNDGYHLLLQLFFVSSWGFENGDSFNGPIWSVSIEVGLYAMFFAFAWLRGNVWLKLISTLATALVMLKFGIELRWASAVLAFFMGGLTFKTLDIYLRSKFRSHDRTILALTLALWCIIFLSGDAAHAIFSKYIYLLVLYPPTIASLVLAEIHRPEALKKVSWIGDITYSTYLLHFPLQLVFVLGVSAFGLKSEIFSQANTFLLYFAALVVLSLASFHWFERPVQSLLRQKLLKPRRERH
ncbi:acyltransferase family protein [Stieleria sp.]|uniref:acyltransferase family protein n=1 Tax=Stieleria sp. TaxID=2795976 RepID=UPI0035657D4A